MPRRHPILYAKTSWQTQGDLFISQGDLFVSAPASGNSALPKPTHPLQPPPGELTPQSLLGKAFLKVGQEDNDAHLEAIGLRLLGRKPH